MTVCSGCRLAKIQTVELALTLCQAVLRTAVSELCMGGLGRTDDPDGQGDDEEAQGWCLLEPRT